MKKDELRIIPLRNYIILGIVLLISILVIYYFYMWVNVYNETKLNSPILNEYMDGINYNELDDYLVENPNTIIYVSVLGDREIRSFEAKLKRAIKNNQIDSDILYMDITNELKNESIKMELNKKYSLNSLSIIKVPSVMVFDNGNLKYIYSVSESGYDIGKLKLFINGIKFNNEENIDG